MTPDQLDAFGGFAMQAVFFFVACPLLAYVMICSFIGMSPFPSFDRWIKARTDTDIEKAKRELRRKGA